jgi:hypothetical protein
MDELYMRATESWWTAAYGGTYMPLHPVWFVQIHHVDRDTDGDGIRDGDDDEDHDDYSNIDEIVAPFRPVPPCKTGLVAEGRNPFNPCVPDAGSRTCATYGSLETEEDSGSGSGS